MKAEEFRQIAHSGGQIIIDVTTQQDGRRMYQVTFQHCRPCAVAVFAVHAVPPGFPVGTADLGGIGSPVDLGPYPGLNVMVYVASDSESMWGAECPICHAYWRSRSPSRVCVSCGFSGLQHMFLTKAQRAFIEEYCALHVHAMESEDGKHVIDLDAVADAVDSVEKPPFYYAEESQQNKFTCNVCNCFQDILGRFGYCCKCRTRNDFKEIEKTSTAIRKRINESEAREDCVRGAVAAFDSFVGQYMRELLRHVPLTKARINRLENNRFHNVNAVRDELNNTFDIDIFKERKFVATQFLRRHVYEHNGGEADENYITKSGDTSVRLKQALRETQESAHETVSIVMRMARSLHEGFHELCPPLLKPDKS